MNKFLLVILCFTIFSCSKDNTEDNSQNDNVDFRQEMRNFVIGISQYSKNSNPNFAVIPQNGISLITDNGEITGSLNSNYLNAIDGNGQEDLFYGYDSDNAASPLNISSSLTSFLNLSKNSGNKILVTDYCSTQSKMSDSYFKNNAENFISFAADQRNLSSIPNFPATIFDENSNVVTNLSEAKNFLYLINAENYSTKSQFINAVTATNYDAVIMDLYFNDGTEFTPSEIMQLKNKFNGGKRIVICYMSIGEAENYRYYWNSSWNGSGKPSWLGSENPNWAGNFKVKYWNSEWQQIIYGNDHSYLKKILNANFDGVYLDIIDAFEYYEN